MFGLGKKPLVTLRVSPATFDELAEMVGSIDENGLLEMSGIALTRGPEPVKPVHRPISKNTAPGAI